MTGSRGPAGGDGDTGAGGEVPDPARGTPEERLRALGADEHGSPGPAPRSARSGSTAAGAAEARVAAELASLPSPPLPAHVLADIDRALAAERAKADAAGSRERVTASPGAGSSGVRRRVLLLVGAVTALLLAVGLGVTLRPEEGSPTAGPGSPPTPGASTPALPTGPPTVPGADVPVLGRADLPRALRGGLGVADAGALTDPRRLAACLGAQPRAAAPPVLGARRVVLEGAPGVLLVLPTGVAARFRLLVVGEDCAAGRPATLSDTDVGR